MYCAMHLLVCDRIRNPAVDCRRIVPRYEGPEKKNGVTIPKVIIIVFIVVRQINRHRF